MGGLYYSLVHYYNQPLRRWIIFVVGAAIVSVLLTVTPAAAAGNRAALPAGTRITVLDRVTGTLSTADPETAQQTPSGSAGGSGFADIDVDDTGRGYAITFELLGAVPLVPSTIRAVDLVAGTASPAVTVVHVDGSPASCPTLEYRAGVVLADCVVERLGIPASLFGTIDPATGVLTPVWEYAPVNTDVGSGLATDPTTGYLYLAAGSNLLRVDLAAQTFQTVATMSAPVLQGDFDRDGVYWATLDVGVPAGSGLDTALATVDLSTGAQDVRGSLDTDGDPTTVSAWGLTVWGAAPAPVPPILPAAPTLPPTGANVDVVTGAGAGLLLAGGIVVMSIRLARREQR